MIIKKDFEKDFNFVRDVGLTFKNIFREIISRKQNKKWDKKLKEIQNLKEEDMLNSIFFMIEEQNLITNWGKCRGYFDVSSSNSEMEVNE